MVSSLIHKLSLETFLSLFPGHMAGRINSLARGHPAPMPFQHPRDLRNGPARVVESTAGQLVGHHGQLQVAVEAGDQVDGAHAAAAAVGRAG